MRQHTLRSEVINLMLPCNMFKSVLLAYSPTWPTQVLHVPWFLTYGR